MRRSVRSAVLALGLTAVMAPAALASPTQQSVMQDDDRLLYQGAGRMQETMRTMKDAGVDMVRVTVLWKVVAERAYPSRAEIRRLGSASQRRAAQRQRRRFEGDDSHTYPEGNWDKFDDLVRYARDLNIGVLFNVTGPGPGWAHAKPPRSLRKYAQAWRPDAGDYKDFVRAVAERYTGRLRDENAGGAKLPRVSTWTLWNEANQAGWLAPQWGTDPDTGLRIPEAAKRYRALFHKGRSALNAAGHGSDRILLGELAPQGTDRKAANEPLTPGRFLREMFCVNANLRPLRGRSARARDCASFGPTRATGFAHHPYTKNVSPTSGPPPRDWFTMANTGELSRLLDGISTASGGKVPAGLPLWMTEFGFESNPPDPHQGVSLADGELWGNQGEFLAWTDPRIASQAQFLLSDAGPAPQHTRGSKAYWKTYQSGLLFANGAAKPAFQSYRFPFLVGRAGDGVTAWGQVRYRPNGVRTAVRLEWRPNARSGWQPVGDIIAVDNPQGYFTASRPAPGPGGEWHAVALGRGNIGVEAASPSRPAP